MIKYILISTSLVFLFASCVKDETLVNRVIGEYSGVYYIASNQTTDYKISVQGDITNLVFDAPKDPNFVSFSSPPDVRTSTEIVCLTNEEDEINATTAFIFRGEEISVNMILFNKISGDTIFYAGSKE